ncbi:MAG: arsenite S-adenosylmethyltransferase [Parcubacteria group bacterium CG10_big_fil_rev_8_21_14_0_10_35_15]|nr:MAG: arsenite S-adenosylmethyltransferase [Parcubacteria group bacterium CG10_big_fil_rev_8_21_14_0_10_35_15]
MENQEIKKVVKEQYGHIASGCGCHSSCCDEDALSETISKSIGYSDQDLEEVTEANLGLGCGNPVAMSKIKAGDVVLDLGSGAGLDCFLASKKVGETGKVIGVDMTPEMIDRAEANVEKYQYKNIEFKLGDIESLPIDDDSIDVIISNCVINLAPDKAKVFVEIKRVLKIGGRAYISDIVLLENLSEEQKNDEYLIASCVGGAVLKDEYLNLIEKAGLKVNILSEDKEISKRQYMGIPLESIKIEIIK